MNFRPVVVGLPRTGFSLTSSILINMMFKKGFSLPKEHLAIRIFAQTLGRQLSVNIVNALESHVPAGGYFFNGNFQYLFGGPIWNHDSLGKRAYFRKYIGLKSGGDFTLITQHPLESLLSYEIIHSHGPFSSWLSNDFSGFSRVASVRHPLGAINSACHSINALASEYLQCTPQIDDQESIRKAIASSKLSNVSFFQALVDPLKRGFDDLYKCKSGFYLVKWEDIVTEPLMTLNKLNVDFEFGLSQADLKSIWNQMGFRNLTGHHLHNYRPGKAFFGDHFDSITNEHIEILKSSGFDEVLSNFGYSPFEYLDESSYNDFQKNISSALRKGEVYDTLEDRLLYEFAFNKSNIDFKSFDFRLRDWDTSSRIERSSVTDPTIENSVSSSVEYSLPIINEALDLLILATQEHERFSDFATFVRRNEVFFNNVDVESSISEISKALGLRTPFKGLSFVYGIKRFFQ